jgi:hypothetical protein
MAAADAGRLHGARGGEVGRAEAHAVHAREAAAMASTFFTPSAVSRMAWIRIGFLTPWRASSWASSWSR